MLMNDRDLGIDGIVRNSASTLGLDFCGGDYDEDAEEMWGV